VSSRQKLVAYLVLTLYTQGMTSKTDRLNLRIEPPLRELFEAAAKSANMTLSSFILGATRMRAEQVLADRVHFSVPPEQWKAFMDALDRPPRTIPRLQRLMQQPSVFEQVVDSEEDKT
jgi:uncharacterized protein (DUF1778 family)